MKGLFLVSKLNSNLASGQIEFKIEDGKGFWKAAGADTWNPFSIDVTHTVYAKAYLDIWNSGRALNAQLFVDGDAVSHSTLDVSNYVAVGNAGTGKKPEISTGNRLV